MSLDAIKQVTQKEQDSQDRKAEAAAAAKRSIADAQRDGKARLQEVRAQAERQVRELLVQAEEKAARHTDEVLEAKRTDCGVLRKKAEGRLDEAASLIVRRVVNS